MYFPVLLSQVQAHLPVVKVTSFSPVEVESPGGRLWRTASDRPAVRKWALRYEDLTDDEAGALEAFYDACAGGWRTFTFADPMSNLLRWSEDIGNEIWGKSAGLRITVSSSVGEGPAEFLIVNSSASAGKVWQELDIAPGSALCFSCETRGGALKLRAGGQEQPIAASGDWSRKFITAVSSGGVQRVEIEVDAGVSVEVRRIQAETQRAPSEYQATFERGGVYAKTRFSEGGLRIVSVAPNRNVAEVVLESHGEDDF
jgi:hypothetical protein